MEHSQARDILKSLPDTPGIYKFLDTSGQVLYVGKAKSIRKRVSSYFARESSAHKTTVLIRKAERIEFTVVDSEHDALLLENTLIKRLQPRYNVLLRDDKTYPLICIKKERFPRIFPTRRIIRDGSEYFGPYSSVSAMHAILDLTGTLFRLRTCSYSLTEDNIARKKFRVCLEYHIGKCKGPCEGLQDEEDYNRSVQEIREILKGNTGMVIAHLKRSMRENAKAYRYEEAAEAKKKMELLQGYRSRSTVVNTSLSNLDVFNLLESGEDCFVNCMRVMNGAIVLSHTIRLRKRIEERPEDLLLLAVTELRNTFGSSSPEIIVPFKLSIALPGAKATVPRRGGKKKLLDLSMKNLKYYLSSLTDAGEKQEKQHAALAQLQQGLHLRELPVHIECFDNSNLQGHHPVSAMAVFRDGLPRKKDYRHYHIRSVEGPDDFSSMAEVITRRYRRLVKEGGRMPQLIIVDGGKGQLSAAGAALERLGLEGKSALIGIAKKLEEIYVPGDPLPVYLDKNSLSLRLIQRLRNEAHRFAISFHRQTRSRGVFKTTLEGIRGIGPETAALLLRKYRSPDGIRAAGMKELEKTIGRSKAALLQKFMNR